MSKRNTKSSKAAESVENGLLAGGPVVDLSPNGSNSDMVTVKHLSKRVTVPTIVGGKTIYIYQATIGEEERIRSAPNNFEASKLLAQYLANSLFNDAEATKPVGTYEEFKDNLSSSELLDLFTRLKDGVVEKKKG